MALGTSLVVDTSDLEHIAARSLPLSDDASPPEGSALLAVERFGFSANNITYAAFGDALGYWSFFPAPDGLGHIPVWGHATILRSGHPDLAEGERCYGFLPMATHLLVAPTDASPRGFTDGSPHRRHRATVYNRYLLASADPFAAASPSPELEVVLRPLFTTSFLLDAGLAEQGWHGADAVVVTSASSRTAIGFAHLLRGRADRPALVGLTSTAHLADTRAAGCYDRVLTYDEVTRLPHGRTAIVDLSGDGRVVASLHHHLGDGVVHSAIVGATHRDAAPVDTDDLPGAPRTFFFAPEVAEAMAERIGPEEIERSLVAAWNRFSHAVAAWIRVRAASGVDDVCSAYAEVLEGRSSPRDGWVMSLRR